MGDLIWVRPSCFSSFILPAHPLKLLLVIPILELKTLSPRALGPGTSRGLERGAFQAWCSAQPSARSVNAAPSPLRYYVPPGPTSACSAQPAPAEWPPTAPSRPARVPRPSIQLDLEDLEELNKALTRAVQAAESIRSTTKHMSRSLSADLRQARSLRGSCLF